MIKLNELKQFSSLNEDVVMAKKEYEHPSLEIVHIGAWAEAGVLGASFDNDEDSDDWGDWEDW